VTVIDDNQQQIEAVLVERIAEVGGVTIEQLLSCDRRKEITFVRHVAIWFARHEWKLSYPEAARLLGRADHTTAIHAVRRIDDLLHRGDPMTRNLVERIRSALGTQPCTEALT
jgi:chromosomal replication initiator protein